MTKNKEAFELSIVPGWIHAMEAGNGKNGGPAGDADPGWKVDIPSNQLSVDERTAILERLGDHPMELYALLNHRKPSWFDEDIASKCVPAPAQAVCGCGEQGCRHVDAVMERVEHKLQAEPLLALALAGITRESLLDAVFGQWAAAVPPVAESPDGEALSKLEEKGKSGPSSGEWLAEAAEQGKLHEPGAAYRDVAVHLDSAGNEGPEVDDWKELLPRVKAVQQVIQQITAEAAEKARESLRGK